MNDNNPERAKWNARYEAVANIGESQRPSQVLVDYQHLLPPSGVALDLACGLGGDALFLAGKGFDVHAWDISSVAIERLNQQAQALGLAIHVKAADLSQCSLGEKQFDIVTVSRFLHRPLFDKIINTLRPSGLVFYQTFIQEKSTDFGPNNPDYLLAENELLRSFNDLRVLAYREEGMLGNTALGFRNEAMIVAQKRGLGCGLGEKKMALY